MIKNKIQIAGVKKVILIVSAKGGVGKSTIAANIGLYLSKQVADEVKGFFKDKIFETIIHRNVRLSEAPSFGKPALLYDANSTGAQNYISLVEEILKNGN